jgi:transcriptional antiterminator
MLKFSELPLIYQGELKSSSSSLARQHDMLKKLRASGQPANVSQFSRDYNVSRRTIARDLRELVQRGQIPPELYPEWDKESVA